MRVTPRVSLSGISVIKLSLILVVALPLSNLSIAFSAAACSRRKPGSMLLRPRPSLPLPFRYVLSPANATLKILPVGLFSFMGMPPGG
jgi:hypothetical protein